MKSLIVEDNLTSRKLLQTYLSEYGLCSVAANGNEAVRAVQEAWDCGEPYDLICLDIMMPEMDGNEVLRVIRRMEKEHGMDRPHSVKIIMTSALDDCKNAMSSFKNGCEAYIAKPIKKEKLVMEIKKLGLIKMQAPA